MSEVLKDEEIVPVSPTPVQPSPIETEKFLEVGMGEKLQRATIVHHLASEDHIDFQYGLFFKIFVLHVLNPFSFPLCIMWESSLVAHNLSLIPYCGAYIQRPRVVMSQLFFSTLFFVCLILAPLRTTSEISNLEIGFGVVCYVAHKLVVGAKYALLSTEQLKTFRTVKMSAEQQERLELINGWGNPTKEVLDEELKRSGKRLGIALEEIKFFVYNSDPSIQDAPSGLLRPNSLEPKIDRTLTIEPTGSPTLDRPASTPETSGVATPSNSKLFRFSVKFGNSKGKRILQSERERAEIDEFYQESTQRELHPMDEKFKKVGGLTMAVRILRDMMIQCQQARAPTLTPRILGVTLAILPGVIRVATGVPFFGTYEPIDIILSICCMTLTWFFYAALQVFLLVGVTDFYRRFILLSILGRMVDPTPCGSESLINLPKSIQKPPFIDLTIPENILSWISLRQVLMDLGFQYRARLAVYSSYALLFALGLVLTLLYQLFAGVNPTIYQIAAISSVAVSILCPLLVMIVHGMRSNLLFNVHLSMLLRIRLNIRELLFSEFKSTARQLRRHKAVFPGTEKQLNACDHFLDLLVQILNVEHQVNPIKILGIEVNTRLLQAIGSVIAGALGIAVKLFTNV